MTLYVTIYSQQKFCLCKTGTASHRNDIMVLSNCEACYIADDGLMLNAGIINGKYNAFVDYNDIRNKLKMKKEDVCVTFVLLVFMVTVVNLELNFNVSEWNVCLPTYSRFLALFSIPLDQCVTECTLRSHCHAVGYMTSVKHCELHTSLDSSGISSSSCLLIYRKDMKGNEVNCILSNLYRFVLVRL